MINQSRLRLLCVLGGVWLLAACGGATAVPAPPSHTPQPTALPTATPVIETERIELPLIGVSFNLPADYSVRENPVGAFLVAPVELQNISPGINIYGGMNLWDETPEELAESFYQEMLYDSQFAGQELRWEKITLNGRSILHAQLDDLETLQGPAKPHLYLFTQADQFAAVLLVLPPVETAYAQGIADRVLASIEIHPPADVDQLLSDSWVSVPSSPQRTRLPHNYRVQEAENAFGLVAQLGDRFNPQGFADMLVLSEERDAALEPEAFVAEYLPRLGLVAEEIAWEPTAVGPATGIVAPFDMVDERGTPTMGEILVLKNGAHFVLLYVGAPPARLRVIFPIFEALVGSLEWGAEGGGDPDP